MNFSQFAGINWNRQENIFLKALRILIVVVIGGMLFLAAIGKLLDNRHFAIVTLAISLAAAPAIAAPSNAREIRL